MSFFKSTTLFLQQEDIESLFLTQQQFFVAETTSVKDSNVEKEEEIAAILSPQ